MASPLDPRSSSGTPASATPPSSSAPSWASPWRRPMGQADRTSWFASGTTSGASRATRPADFSRPQRAPRSRLVDRCEPILVAGVLAAHGVEVDLRDALRDRPDLARTDVAMVDARDRRDLHARPAHEHLVADVELGAVDTPHVDRKADVRGDTHDVAANDALQDVVGRRRRQELAVAVEDQ